MLMRRIVSFSLPSFSCLSFSPLPPSFQRNSQLIPATNIHTTAPARSASLLLLPAPVPAPAPALAVAVAAPTASFLFHHPSFFPFRATRGPS
ncbi:hypothetical protein LZ31DRAFT_61726 [Colletotrichum somersetense]|nr:hypothetical protein LZ31DRAFT_61726 [Colletotrichum somersetense]